MGINQLQNAKIQLDKKHEYNMQKAELERLKKEYKAQEKAARSVTKNKLSASKIMMIGIIFVCLEIVIFAEWIMATRDSSALYVLIGIPAALAASFWAYANKSKAENTTGGIVYETTMERMRQQENESDDGAVG